MNVVIERGWGGEIVFSPYRDLGTGVGIHLGTGMVQNFPRFGTNLLSQLFSPVPTCC